MARTKQKKSNKNFDATAAKTLAKHPEKNGVIGNKEKVKVKAKVKAQMKAMPVPMSHFRKVARDVLLSVDPNARVSDEAIALVAERALGVMKAILEQSAFVASAYRRARVNDKVLYQTWRQAKIPKTAEDESEVGAVLDLHPLNFPAITAG